MEKSFTQQFSLGKHFTAEDAENAEKSVRRSAGSAFSAVEGF